MPTKIYVNLPVKDLARSTEFFSKLGFAFDKRFSNDQAGCLIISDDIYAMLITEPFFRSFTTKELADADPDGHLWEVFHMDPAALPAG